MPHYSIDAQKTALVVYDMALEMITVDGEDMPEARPVIPRLARLIEGCREAGIQIVFVRQVLKPDRSDAGRLDDIFPGSTAHRRGDPGTEIHPTLGRLPADWLIDKNRFHAFWGTDLDERLRAIGIDTIIVSGCSTANGCETMVRESTTRDYKTIFVSDGSVTRPLRDIGWGAFPAEEVHRMILTMLGHVFARIASTDEILGEIGANGKTAG